MASFRHFAKKAYLRILRISWYLGGQKEHKTSHIKVPPTGFLSTNAQIVFADQISLREGVLIMDGARLICAGMPPYASAEGSIEVGANSVIREGAIIQTYGGHISIGESTTINAYCVLQGNGGITIGNNTLIAAGVKIFSANHNFSERKRPIRQQGETKGRQNRRRRMDRGGVHYRRWCVDRRWSGHRSGGGCKQGCRRICRHGRSAGKDR